MTGPARVVPLARTVDKQKRDRREARCMIYSDALHMNSDAIRTLERS